MTPIVTVQDRALVRDFFASQGLTYVTSSVYTSETTAIRESFARHVARYPALSPGFVFEKHLKAYLENSLPLPKAVAQQHVLGPQARRYLETRAPANLGICWINDELQFGCFALQDLSRGTFLGVYVGEEKKLAPGEDSRYALASAVPLEFQDEPGGLVEALRDLFRGRHYCVVDPLRVGNETRFMNHAEPDAVVLRPDGKRVYAQNARAHYVFHGGALNFVFHASRDILAGEELRWDYGSEYVRGFFGGNPDRSAFFLHSGRVVALPETSGPAHEALLMGSEIFLR